RGIEVAHDQAVVGLRHALDQRRGIEPGCIELLQDIVAGGGKKACLANIRFVGSSALPNVRPSLPASTTNSARHAPL
ncbi:hypothetical protein ACC841_36725, partial [Rhizobium ruizarguesonis]